ncbi:MAG: asparagine synthase-related protein, partial [Nitrospira sp.]|nr:asparagine synthase-related protein [Nitrospira sp.]
MPGIVGIIGRGPRGKYASDVRAMVDCMRHEPFYKFGTYINEELGIYAGWTCHPDSYADCMPAMNANKDVILLFAGEEFSGQSAGQPHKAETLLQRYESEGEGFLRGLNGWFSGLLVDRRNSMVRLFNDRYGMQRIYYHEESDAVLFGSEAKSILKVRPQLRALNPQGLGELISCNCVLEHRTLFPKIFLLPGASLWTWKESARPIKREYFNASEWENLPPLEEGEFLSRLSQTVRAIIPRYFHEKGQVGLSLTGGLDSRMIMACLNPAPGEVPCYTFGGSKDMLDITIARKISEVCGQTYSVVRIGPSFFSDFSVLAEKTIYVTDGTLDVSSTHDMYFNKLARGIAPIRVTGKFGSEVIRDHTMFNAAAVPGGLFTKDLEEQAKKAVATLDDVKKGHKLSVAVFKDFPWREYNKIMIEQSQSVFRSPYMDNDLVELMYRAPIGARSSNQPQRGIIRE